MFRLGRDAVESDFNWKSSNATPTVRSSLCEDYGQRAAQVVRSAAAGAVALPPGVQGRRLGPIWLLWQSAGKRKSFYLCNHRKFISCRLPYLRL